MRDSIRYTFIAFLLATFVIPCLLFFGFNFFSLPLCAISPRQGNLFGDMLIVDYWNKRLNDRLPVMYNHVLEGGYFAMPSARMGCEGEIGLGYSHVPPYRNYNLRVQLIDRLEISGSYRIFKGVDDPILTPLGFGDLSDKGANFKLSIFSPEDSGYKLPGIAFGMEDFLGTRSFKSNYVVLTQVFLDYNFEASLGYGAQHIRGFFGGISWFPFRQWCQPYLNNLCLVAEYDATPYKDPEIEKHPKGRVKKSPINYGIKYRLWDYYDFSVSHIRGDAVAFSVSTFYNFGSTEGFLPKIDDALPYQAPINTEPLGALRPDDMMVQDLLYATRAQGFDLLGTWLSETDCGCKLLRLQLTNPQYRVESEVRARLNNLLAYLIPADIDLVIVVIEGEGCAIQEYHYDMEYVREYGERKICSSELGIITPMRDVTNPNHCAENLIFKQHRNLWNMELVPKTCTYFGSSKGKFKYALGLNSIFNGYITDDLYYNCSLGYIFASELGKLRGIDLLNPSQLINVRTDSPLYYKNRALTLDDAYILKTWNLGCGWFSRISLGYFEQAYGGIASELLYYPVNCNWAIGFESAVLKKRKYTGVAFTNEIRKLDGYIPTFRKFLGSQYFLDLYYEWREAKIDFKVMAGKFLANDYGARFEVARYFDSGLRITFWYTLTNGHDRVNDKTYYDKGVSFSMPLDIFYTYTDRSRWYYGMSAWLRDVGASSATGPRLYEMIREQRNY